MGEEEPRTPSSTEIELPQMVNNEQTEAEN